MVEEALSIRGIFNKKNEKVTKSNYEINYDLLSKSKDSPDLIDKAKLSINSKLRNNLNTSKKTRLNEANHDAFDLETYKKFLSFLKFQEMMDKYNT